MKIGDASSPVLSVTPNSDGSTTVLLNRGYPRSGTTPFLIVDTTYISLCLDAELAAELAAKLTRVPRIPGARVVSIAPTCDCGGDYASQPEGSGFYSCGHLVQLVTS